MTISTIRGYPPRIINDLITANKTEALSAKQGKEFKEYIDKGANLPVATILMFNGSGWIDNNTMPGWYACISDNIGLGCPDLENQFIRGCIVANLGATAGSNNITLSPANLPAHTHSINHDHGSVVNILTGTRSVDHQHSYTKPNTTYYDINPTPSYPFWGISPPNVATGNQTPTNHTHVVTVNLPNYGGNSGASGSGIAIDNRPSYYSIIFIKRVS